MKPKAVTNLDIVFPTDVSHLMPSKDEIPDEFYSDSDHNPYIKKTSQWFYKGIKKNELQARDGIDANKALAHLSAILGSFEPEHQYKLAAVAYLMSQWFNIV